VQLKLRRTIRRFGSLIKRTPNLSARAMRLYRRGGISALRERIIREYGRVDEVPMQAHSLVEAFLAESTTITDLRLYPSPQPKISIVIPVYGEHLTTFACLKSIAAHPPSTSYEVIVMDDASPESAADALAKVTGIRLVRNEKNLGFIGNVNAGARGARGEYLLILNNDTVLTAGAIDSLLNTFDHHTNVGLVGAKLLNRDGTLQEAGGIIWRDGTGWNYGRGENAAEPRFCYVRDVDYCSGAALVIRRELFLELGCFDEFYRPAYYEDTDLAFRVRERGLRVLFQPAAQIFHLEGVSHGRDETTGIKAYQVVNAKKFHQRWRDVLVAHASNTTDPDVAALRPSKGNVLVVEAAMLTPNQDSGSVRMINIMRTLKTEGYHVTFVGENLEFVARYVDELCQLGIETLFAPFSRSILEVIEKRKEKLDFVVLCRHYVATHYVDAIRALAPKTKIVFDTVDLHFLREEREAQLRADPAKVVLASEIKKQELGVVRDLTSRLWFQSLKNLCSDNWCHTLKSK
jgi:O-antigen biosynthesis protein